MKVKVIRTIMIPLEPGTVIDGVPEDVFERYADRLEVVAQRSTAKAKKEPAEKKPAKK